MYRGYLLSLLLDIIIILIACDSSSSPAIAALPYHLRTVSLILMVLSVCHLKNLGNIVRHDWPRTTLMQYLFGN